MYDWLKGTAVGHVGTQAPVDGTKKYPAKQAEQAVKLAQVEQFKLEGQVAQDPEDKK